jgi:hypothetical protein
MRWPFKLLNKTIINQDSSIIDYDPSYEFCLLENAEDRFFHPVDNYYLQLHDLSINLLISLKWVKWGHKFFTELSKELEQLGEGFSNKNIITKSIQKFNLIDIKEELKLIIIDDRVVRTEKDFYLILETFYLNKNLPLFDQNTKVHLKLKLNLREYLIISNLLFPTFIKASKN